MVEQDRKISFDWFNPLEIELQRMESMGVIAKINEATE